MRGFGTIQRVLECPVSLAASHVVAAELARIWRFIHPCEFCAVGIETGTACGHEHRIAALESLEQNSTKQSKMCWIVDAPRGVRPSLSSMHPRARCTTLPTGRKAVVQKIYRHVSHFRQLCKGVSTLVEWMAAADLNILYRLTFDVQRPDAVDTIANPFPAAGAPVEVGIQMAGRHHAGSTSVFSTMLHIDGRINTHA